MKKLILLSVMFLFAIQANTQELAISFNQNGYMYSGIAYVESNTYALQSPNGQVCGFSASFEVIGGNTIKMYVFNPTLNGYIPATYYLYENGVCEVYVQGYVFKGNWYAKESGSATGGGNVSFRGKCCNGSVGCSCAGFQPITDGKEWEKSYCKKCGHHKRNHKR